MTTKRIVQLRTHPLTHGELINALSSKDPIFCEEEDTFLGMRINMYVVANYKYVYILIIFNYSMAFKNTYKP